MKTSENFYKPMTPDQRTAQQKFQALNRWVTDRRGFITSSPGEAVIRLECLPGSTLPDELEAQGYSVIAAGEGERILSGSIVERFTRRADGELELMTEGSTKPVATTITHAGIVKVERYNAFI